MLMMDTHCYYSCAAQARLFEFNLSGPMRNDHQEIDDLRLGNSKLGQPIIQPVAPRHTAAAVKDKLLNNSPELIYSQVFEKPHVSPGYNFFRQFQMSSTFQLHLATASAANLWLARTGS